jgi:Holliday junction resolvase
MATSKDEYRKRGKASRSKGRKNEYLLRDHLRLVGFTADRVPTSGAAQGFKGDVKASRDGKTYLFELKVRANEYQSIYDYYAANESGGSVFVLTQFDPVRDTSIHISDSVVTIINAVPAVDAYEVDSRKESQRMLKKLVNMRKLLQECDILVIKIDREKFLFIRYL